MGQTSETPFKEELQNTQIISTDEHNNITYFKDNTTNKKIMLRKQILTDFKYYDELLKAHSQRKQIKSEHILKLKNLQGKIDQTPCATYYQVYAIWEHETNTLADFMKQRIEANKPFKNQQIWSLASDCIKGLADMEKKNFIHEKITVEAIVLEEGPNKLVFKVKDPLSIPESDNYLLVSKNLKTSGIYLSPDQCNALQMMSYCKKSTKDDVWALGMVLLQVTLMKNQEQCYYEDSRKINTAKIIENVSKVGKSYGEQLKKLLAVMLQCNKKARPSWSQLCQLLSDRESNTRKITDVTNLHTNVDIRESPQVLAYKSIFVDQNETYSFAKNNPHTNLNPRLLYQKQNVFVHRENVNVHYPLNQFREFTNYPKPNNQPIMYAPIQRHPIQNNFVQYEPKTNFNYPIMNTNNLNIVQNKAVEVKKFTSPASCQGLLFNNTIPSKQIKQVMFIQSYCEKPKIEQTRHQPKISNQPKQKPKTFNNDIKNAESITYEGDFRPIIVNNFVQKQRVQQKIEKQQTQPVEMQISYSENQIDNIQYVIETFPVGSRYEGYKLKNMRHGQGKFFYQDGGMYDGQWKYNKMNGKGMLYYQSGILAYDGQWQDDQFEGRGKLFNQSPQKVTGSFDYQNFDQIGQCWQFYDGQFKNDLKEGRGKLMLTNGQYYVGSFSQDMIQGSGKFFTKKGTIKGVWQANHLVRKD